MKRLADRLCTYTRAHVDCTPNCSEELSIALHDLVDLHDQYGYSIGILEDHADGGIGDLPTCFWAVTQMRKDHRSGGFNKAMGGIPYSRKDAARSHPGVQDGDIAVGLYNTWNEANIALLSMDENVRKSFAIYPVVAFLGQEPRHTPPLL